MKHSKGPWLYTINTGSPDTIRIYRVSSSKTKDGIAVCGNLYDARLIASAPEMLETLQDSLYKLKSLVNLAVLNQPQERLAKGILERIAGTIERATE